MARNKSELETIMEKAKEEDIVMSMSNANMQKMDIEESYSFSLRNYPSKNQAGRSSNLGQNATPNS